MKRDPNRWGVHCTGSPISITPASSGVLLGGGVGCGGGSSGGHGGSVGLTTATVKHSMLHGHSVGGDRVKASDRRS